MRPWINVVERVLLCLDSTDMARVTGNLVRTSFGRLANSCFFWIKVQRPK